MVFECSKSASAVRGSVNVARNKKELVRIVVIDQSMAIGDYLHAAHDDNGKKPAYHPDMYPNDKPATEIVAQTVFDWWGFAVIEEFWDLEWDDDFVSAVAKRCLNDSGILVDRLKEKAKQFV